MSLLAATLHLLLMWEEEPGLNLWLGEKWATQGKSRFFVTHSVLISVFLKGKQLQASHEFLDVEGEGPCAR